MLTIFVVADTTVVGVVVMATVRIRVVVTNTVVVSFPGVTVKTVVEVDEVTTVAIGVGAVIVSVLPAIFVTVIALYMLTKAPHATPVGYSAGEHVGLPFLMMHCFFSGSGAWAPECKGKGVSCGADL
jgi:hypothetical protein